ncbi:cytochrome P450 9e2-like [Leptopilina boulardi]|uniref:cytochrome P450 9e2-like n=1 Tax=Leptopilina boulardi TaxID=63433 RepID=UPI0021F68FB6|nr:cytochrome P450 9e2-like [Leptopilina boulardi]
MFLNLWTLIFTTFAGVLALYFYYSLKKLNIFQNHGIPYKSPMPIFGNQTPVIFRKIYMGHLIEKLYNENSKAKYFGLFDFMNPVIVLRDMELIKTVTVKNFENFPNHKIFFDESWEPLFSKNLFALQNEKWHNVRTLLSPAFTSSKMKIMYKLISECAINFAEFLSNDKKAREMIEMKSAFTRYTNDVIATCAFGISVDSMKNPNNEFYLMGKEATDPVKVALKFFFLRSFPIIMKFFNIRLISNAIDRFFTEIIRSTIKTRDNNGITRPDMLQLMMDSRGKEGNKIDLTPEEMTAQAFIFFFAGFDPVSTNMSFAAHELAVNPNIQSRLQEEIDSVLRATNGEPTYEAINGMEYLDAVLNETLRKHPIVPFLDRVCNKRFELPATLPDAKPITMEPGMTIWIPVSAIHSNPDYYDEPEKFNPDRFLSNGTANNKSMTFLTFGIGPRQCIGNRFAILETKVVLFHLLAKCNFKVCSKTNEPLILSKKTFARNSEGGFWMKIEKRNK